MASHLRLRPWPWFVVIAALMEPYGCGGDGAAGDGTTSTASDEAASASSAGTSASTAATAATGTASSGAATSGADLPPAATCMATPLAEDPTLRIGIDEILPGEIYVVYSGKERNGALENVSNIYLFRGQDEGATVPLWVFGAGYGDPGGDWAYLNDGSTSSRSAMADVADVDHVVRACMGLDPSLVEVRFLAPHFHLDHLNQEFFTALEAFGYDVATIFVHVLDTHGATCGTTSVPCCGEPCSKETFGAPYDPPWNPETLARFTFVGAEDGMCLDPVMDFETPLAGTVRVLHDRGSHTPGSLILESDVLGVRIWGAAVDQSCSPQTPLHGWKIHGIVDPP